MTRPGPDEIVVDAHGRTSLARFLRPPYARRYDAEELEDGTIVLRPLVVISPARLAAIRAAFPGSGTDE